MAILVASNWSVGLPLSFLGMQTRSLSVGIWLVLGLATGLGISLLLQFLQLPELGKSDAARWRLRDRQPKSSSPGNYKPPKDVQRKVSQTSDDDLDWDSEPPPKSEEWDFEDEESPQTRTSSYSEPNYEAKQEPTTKNVSGSVYSYSYRQPQDTGVGKSEAIREANYRVIIPPQHQTIETPADEDDWGFDLDDEDIDGDRR
ncbi:hypothetical protein C7B64_10950 [Merismopedia glauca CCAP 1448/3]|uniref:LapA family protein n=1 Tax=Merismopedia glauca CCAP 1448/3 TaxID=1296344 RepID=A0A2T1C3Q1_9CYAN|nr:hypothetical protein C7B64_10950 [Merismopedia glauca CCAP 1448/3]